MNGDNAVVLFSQLAAPLPLHTGCQGAFLGDPRLIDQANGAEAVSGPLREGEGEVLLQQVADLVLVPAVVAQEFLERADGEARSKGNRLTGLAFEIGQ